MSKKLSAGPGEIGQYSACHTNRNQLSHEKPGHDLCLYPSTGEVDLLGSKSMQAAGLY